MLPNFHNIQQQRINGATISDIAKMLGVGRQSIYKWMKEHEDFNKIMSEAETQMHARIAVAATHVLLNRLKPQWVIEEIWEDGVLTKQKKKQVLPDPQYALSILKSINPKVWDSIALKKTESTDEDLSSQILSTLTKYTTD